MISRGTRVGGVPGWGGTLLLPFLAGFAGMSPKPQNP
jgi:enoyl-CoA hydratase/carnithine racemase